jgi:hypothetical protein
MRTIHLVILIVGGIFFASMSVVKSHHLLLEQEWSASLQKMVDTDLEIIAEQNEYVKDLQDFIYNNHLPIPYSR